MKIVIDIPEEVKAVIDRNGTNEIVGETLWQAVKNSTPQRTGKWLDKKTTIKKAHGIAYGRWGCSVCKAKQPHKSNFCPNCGADMREEGEQE